MKGYYFITDENLSLRGNIADVQEALSAGVEVIQYRNKTATSLEMYEEALKLRDLCKKVKFLINDRVDIAMAVAVSGKSSNDNLILIYRISDNGPIIIMRDTGFFSIIDMIKDTIIV